MDQKKVRHQFFLTRLVVISSQDSPGLMELCKGTKIKKVSIQVIRTMTMLPQVYKFCACINCINVTTSCAIIKGPTITPMRWV